MSATLLAQGGIEQMGVINAHRHGARRKNRHAHGRTSQCLAPVRRLQSGQARHRMIGDVGATVLRGAKHILGVQRLDLVKLVAQCLAQGVEIDCVRPRIQPRQSGQGLGQMSSSSA